MRAVKSVSIDSERRVIITYLDGSTETLYPNCIWCDSEALRQLIKDLLEEKADAITQTIENVTIATFADGADEGLIKKLLVSIDPIQEGTGNPSPANVRPISGRTGLSVVRYGKNLLDDSIKFVSATGTSLYIGSNSTDYHLYLPTGTYNLSCVFASGVRYAAYIKEENGSEITIWNKASGLTSKSFTLDGGNYRIIFYNPAGDGGVNADSVSNIMLNVGDSALPYEAYKGNTYSVNWETEAGTVYGGTLDVVSGKLSIDRAYAKISDLSWSSLSNLAVGVMRAKISDVKIPINNATPTTAIMDCRMPLAYTPLAATSINHFGIRNDGALVIPMNKEYTNADDFVTEYGNHEICYPLVRTTEIQLTPQEITTLLGDNNIWADSGNILDLEYTADTKLYIGEQQSGTSGVLGSGKQTIVNPDLQPVSEKTWKDLTEVYKEEAKDERGEE